MDRAGCVTVGSRGGQLRPGGSGEEVATSAKARDVRPREVPQQRLGHWRDALPGRDVGEQLLESRHRCTPGDSPSGRSELRDVCLQPVVRRRADNFDHSVAGQVLDQVGHRTAPFLGRADTVKGRCEGGVPRNYADRRQNIKALVDSVRDQLKRRIADNAVGHSQTTVEEARVVAADAVADPSAILKLRRVNALVHSDPGCDRQSQELRRGDCDDRCLPPAGSCTPRPNIPTLITTATAKLGSAADTVAGMIRC